MLQWQRKIPSSSLEKECKTDFKTAMKILWDGNIFEHTFKAFPDVYQLECSCGSVYIGDIKKRVLTRAIEHQQ